MSNTATVEAPKAPKATPVADLVKALIAACKAKGLDVVDTGDPEVQFDGKTIAWIHPKAKFVTVTRARTKPGKGMEREASDHKAAFAWTKEWEAFKVAGKGDVKTVAAAIAERKPKAEKAEKVAEAEQVAA